MRPPCLPSFLLGVPGLLGVLGLLGLLACGEVIPPEPDPCTGVCECRVDTDCGSHEVCDDQTTSRTCTCAAGYAEDLAGACVWSGVVTDPGFQSASAWTIDTGGAVDVNLNEAGMVEPGAARFQGQGLCGLARITQKLQMPRRSRAEPLVAQLTYRSRGDIFSFVPPPALGIGPVWQDNLPPAPSQFRTSRVCLGAAQYAPEDTRGRGGERVLSLMPASTPTMCTDPQATVDVDRLEIVPANPGECPDAGAVLNGDAEAEGGWILDGASGNAFSAKLEAGVGEGNSRGVRLFTRNRCSRVSATTRVSISSAIASPALSFFNKTSAALPGVSTFSALSRIALPELTATGAPLTQKVCIPASLRGGVFDFFAGMDLAGVCADVVNAESIIDNVRVLDDPSCGTDTAITDPGFESSLALVGSFANPGRSFVRALRDPAAAHAGNGVLQLSVMQLCSEARWQASAIVPPAGGGGGPALRFFYRARPLAMSTFAVFTPGGSFTPMLNDQWNQGTICLNPKLAGRAQEVTFVLSTSGSCSTVFPAEVVFVDDLQVTTAASCPSM